MKRSANWQKYLSLDQRKYAGRYVVIAGGRLIGSGKNLEKLVKVARKKYPREIPLVASVRDPRKICVY